MLRSTLDMFAVIFLFLASGKGQEILESPGNQTVPLGSNTTVSCRTVGLLRWSVTQNSNLPLDVSTDLQIASFAEEEIYILGDALGNNATLEYSSKVVVTGTRANNGTVLHCRAGQSEVMFTVRSNPATVLVFGHPAPPTDLTALIVAPLQLNLSWAEPFAPPGVEIGYLVNAESLDMDSESTIEELHSTYYIFEDSHSCEKYKFTVIAVNTAGRSDRSQAINMSVPALPDIMVESFRQSVHIEEHDILVEITFKALQACRAYPVTNYTIALTDVFTGTSVGLGPYFPMEDGTVTISANTLDDDVEENVHYTYVISAHNVVGTTSFKSGEFYTTDVQPAESISVNDDIIKIMCYFARGSQALGCSVELVSLEDPVLWNITRENGSQVAERNITTTLPAHCYNISVSDLERDGIVGEVTVLMVEAEWDESCNPDSSSDSSSENDSLSISGAATSVNPIIITAALLGGVLVLLPVIVVLIVAGHYHMMKAKRGKYLPSEKGCSVGHDNEYHVTQETNIPLYDPIENYLKKEESVAATEAGYCQPIDQLISPRQQNEDQVAATDSELSERVYSPLVPSSQKKQPTEEGTQNGHSPDYAQLNQFPIYHVLESNSAPSPVEFQPPEQPQITETSLNPHALSIPPLILLPEEQENEVHSSSQEVQFTEL